MADNDVKNTLNSQSSTMIKDVFSIFPKRHEKTFLVIYTVLVPYILGLLFFLFTIGEGIFNILSSIPYLVTWLVGYEVFSILLLLYILNKNLFFTLK